MREVQTHKALTGLSMIARTLIVGRHRHGGSTLLDVADATRMDARAGGQGVAVKLMLSTDPADAPVERDGVEP